VSWSDGVTDNPRTDTNVTGNVTVTAVFAYMSGGGSSPSYTMVTIQVMDGSNTAILDSSGVLQQSVSVSSADGSIGIYLPAGTRALDGDGDPLSGISVDTVDPPPAPDGCTILAAFDFNPDGAVFDPGIQITINFDPAEVGEGEIVTIAFYDEDADVWVFIMGNINADGSATFIVDHFTVFALMAKSESSAAPAETPMPTPTPTLTPEATIEATETPTTTTTPTVASTPTPTATPTVPSTASDGEDNGPDDWVIIVLAVAGVALIVGLVGAIARRRRA